MPVHLNASKGKGSLTHLTFKEYLKIYFESLRLNLAQIKRKSKSIIFEGLKHHLKEEAIDRRKRKLIDVISNAIVKFLVIQLGCTL